MSRRTVWLHHDVLLKQFAREVHRRPDKTIHAGEQVRIWQLDERESNAGRTYVDYRVQFPDGPEAAAEGNEGSPLAGESDDPPFEPV